MYLTITALTVSLPVTAQSERKLLREGNHHYKQEEYVRAGEAYGRALEAKPDYYKGRFNQGNALYKIGDYDSAVTAFTSAATLAEEKAQGAAAYYNLGNAHMELKEYDEAIKAYKETLKIDPTDEDARYNLAYAQKMLQQDQSQQDSGDDLQQQEQKQDQEKKDNQQQQQPQQQMGKEQTDQMLKTLEKQEQDVQNKMQKLRMPVQPAKTEKDW